MRLVCREFSADKLKADLLCLMMYENDFRSVETQAIDMALGGQISALQRNKHFSAGLLETHALIPFPSKPFARLLLVGLGSRKDAYLERLRKAGGIAGQTAANTGVKTVVLVAPAVAGTSLQAGAVEQAIIEGFNLGGYFNDSLRTGEPKRSRPRQVTLQSSNRTPIVVKRGATRGLLMSNLQNHCRDLSSCPSNIMTPGFLATEARRLGRKYGLRVTVYRRSEIEKLKMGAFLAVAKGSKEAPYLIKIDYKPRTKGRKKVILVGKGITFDTGGISIKPAENMGEMKQDMTGAAVVLCTMAAIAKLRPALEVTAFIPTCENMVSSSAYKPGDVVTTSIGKTIEIVNTDAEGRLLLADVLGHASKLKPDYLFDVATLTGAAAIALGHGGAAILSTSDELVGRFFAASNHTGEKLWQLPLWEEYEHQFKSGVADMTNAGGKPAGMILKKFTGGIPWLHMDIAGVDFEYRGSEYTPRGASGFGVRVLTEALCKL
jgi:leucyl aminopeptidase